MLKDTTQSLLKLVTFLNKTNANPRIYTVKKSKFDIPSTDNLLTYNLPEMK